MTRPVVWVPLVFSMLAAGCGTDPHPAGTGNAANTAKAVNTGEDEKVKSLGTVEVTARLVEVPEGAIFERDLYHYAAILKYEVVAVHRGPIEKGATIYVGHYDPWKARDQAAQGQVKDVGGTLRRFEAGRLHRMALEAPMDEFYLGAIVDKYFGKRNGSAYWAVWTNPAD
jgi:hypothetical protein